MYCHKCGVRLVDDSQFCMNCGAMVPHLESRAAMDASPGLPHPQSATSSGWGWVARILAFIVVVVAVWGVGARSCGMSDAEVNKRVAAMTSRAPRRTQFPVIQNWFTVPAAGYITFRFIVEPDMSSFRLVGTYRAAGGAGNDIRVAVASEEESFKIVNNQEARVYYSSQGQRTDGEIDLKLGPGRYVVVFSNAFSLVSEKRVYANLVTEYYR